MGITLASGIEMRTMVNNNRGNQISTDIIEPMREHKWYRNSNMEQKQNKPKPMGLLSELVYHIR